MKIHVTDNIRRIRILKGYSQEYLGIKLRMSQQAYQQIECGSKDITWKKIEQIADILEVPVSSLLETEQLKDDSKIERLLSEISALKELIYGYFDKLKKGGGEEKGGGGKSLTINYLQKKTFNV